MNKKVKYKGLKLVPIKTGEIRHTVKRMKANLEGAKNIIIVIEYEENRFWAQSSCKDDSTTHNILTKMAHRYLD